MEDQGKTLKTEIVVVDSFSSVLNKFNTSLFSAGKFVDSLRGKLNAPMKTNSLTTNVQGISTNADLAKSSIDSLTTSVGSLVGTLSGLAVASLGFSSLIETADATQNIRSRFNLINDGRQTTRQLEQLLFESAQRSRVNTIDLGGVVARIGLNAGDAFESTKEVIAFSEILAKQYAIAGATQDEMTNSLIQLTQGLSSGVLRGEELNSVFESAPTIIQSIADYLQVNISQIRDMASEGKLTADVVKKAIFASLDQVNSRFNQLQPTWAQSWVVFKNEARKSFDDVYRQISSLTTGQGFQVISTGAISAIRLIGSAFTTVANAIGSVADFIKQNISTIGPIVASVASAFVLANVATLTYRGAVIGLTAAQMALNGAMLANPVGLVVAGVGALATALVGVVNLYNKVTGATVTFTDVVGSAFGIVYNTIRNVVVDVDNLFASFINGVASGFDAIATIGTNVWQRMQASFWDMLASVTGGIADFVKEYTGIDIKFSPDSKLTLSEQAQSFAQKANELRAGPTRKFDDSPIYTPLSSSSKLSFARSMEDGKKKLNFGIDKVSGLFSAPDVTSSTAFMDAYRDDALKNQLEVQKMIANNTARTAKNTGYEQELKYIRDYGVRQNINRLSNTSNNNNIQITTSINSQQDADDLIEKLVKALGQASDVSAEGVH